MLLKWGESEPPHASLNPNNSICDCSKCCHFCLFIFSLGRRVKTPTLLSSCDIISPGQHGLLASIFPRVPTVAEDDSHLDFWLYYPVSVRGSVNASNGKDKSANGICQLAVLLVGGEDAAPLMR